MSDVRPIDANRFEEYLKTAFGKFDLHFLLVGAIRSEPTLDYAPVRHGEWYDGAFNNSKCCSVCGKYATKVKTHNQPVFDYGYCPNCGAKMDGDQYD